MMFENVVLILKIVVSVGEHIEERINVFRVDGGMFKPLVQLVSNREIEDVVMAWCKEYKYTRVVTFDPDDLLSGLYAKEGRN